jgi:splicing factor 3B subunit 3
MYCPQVHPNGLRHIRPDRRINEWKVPGRRTITRAASNERQVAIALGGDVIYFEQDQTGQLLETDKKEVSRNDRVISSSYHP